MEEELCQLFNVPKLLQVAIEKIDEAEGKLKNKNLTEQEKKNLQNEVMILYELRHIYELMLEDKKDSK